MSRKQIAKPVYVNFHFSEAEVIEMFLLMENLFNILDNRNIIRLFKFTDDNLNSLIYPIEQAFNNRVNEPNGLAVMTVLSKDLTAFKRILKHIQIRSKCYSGEINESIDRLNEMLCRPL
jgi:hypothetical protein